MPSNEIYEQNRQNAITSLAENLFFAPLEPNTRLTCAREVYFAYMGARLYFGRSTNFPENWKMRTALLSKIYVSCNFPWALPHDGELLFAAANWLAHTSNSNIRFLAHIWELEWDKQSFEEHKQGMRWLLDHVEKVGGRMFNSFVEACRKLANRRDRILSGWLQNGLTSVSM